MCELQKLVTKGPSQLSSGLPHPAPLLIQNFFFDYKCMEVGKRLLRACSHPQVQRHPCRWQWFASAGFPQAPREAVFVEEGTQVVEAPSAPQTLSPQLVSKSGS